MRIAVTGAYGIVGLNLVENLARQGHRVIAVGRAAPDAWVTSRLRGLEDRVIYRSADLQRRGDLTAALDDCELDSIVHAAAITATTEEVERDSASAEGWRPWTWCRSRWHATSSPRSPAH